MERRKRVARLCVAALVVAMCLGAGAGPVTAGKAGGGAGGPPWAALIGPGVARFVPGTDVWELPFKVVGRGWGDAPPGLARAQANLDGRELDQAGMELTAGPWAEAADLGEAEVAEAKAAALAQVRGRAVGRPDLPRLEAVVERLAAAMSEVPASVIVLRGNAGVPEGEHWVDVSLEYQVGGKTVTVTDQVQVIVAAIAREPGWFPADLHLHSTFSDGDQSIAVDRADLTANGYSIGYVTDHSGSLMSAGAFDSLGDTYPAACAAASDTTTSMFPGAEMEIGHDTWLGWNGDGHYLCYGVASTAGLNDDTWSPQTGIDKVDANNPPLSSGAIAHPNHLLYGWEDWGVLRYDGMELMSGLQWYFDVASGPVTRWRSECARLKAYSDSFRPSVRSGSDYHSDWTTGWTTYVTQIHLPSDEIWFGGSWQDRWAAVSAALRDGRTTISRKGSLAYVTADGLDVGSSVVRLGGNVVSFEIHFRPIVSGSYSLALYQDDRAVTVWSASGSCAAGTSYSWTKAYTYPGGSHYYWLYVSGADYCYTTPIYMHP